MAFDLGGWIRGEQGLIPDYGGKSTTQSVKDITGAGENDGWFPGDQSHITQYIPGVGAPHPEGWVAGDQSHITKYIPGFQTTDNIWNPADPVAFPKPGAANYDPARDSKETDDGSGWWGNTFDWLSGDKNKMAGPKEPTKDMNWWRKNIDPSNNEQVAELQRFLGVKDDGQFGPKTQAAWRNAVSQNVTDENRLNEQKALVNKMMPFKQFHQEVGPQQEQLKYNYNPDILAGKIRNKGKLGGMLAKGWTNLDEKLGGVLPGGYKKDAESMTQEEFENYGK